MKKLFLSIALLASSIAGYSQTALYTLDCEKFANGSSASTANNISYDRAQCWALGSFTYINTAAVINGTYSGQSNQATNLSLTSSWIKTPWIKPGFANITLKHKISANNGTIRRIVASYIPYDANAASVWKEGTLVRFDSISYAAGSLPLTTTNVSFALPAAIQNSSNPYKILISFVGSGGNSRFIVDDVFVDGIYVSDPSSAYCLPLPTIQDADSDGVADGDDAYPNDATRAYNNYFPSSGYSTLMFEDLWPTTGDYDFNDLVVVGRQNVVLNAANKVVELKINMKVKAIGASFHNGFGIQLDGINPSKITSVSGTNTHNAAWVSTSANGTESGQTFANIIVFDDAFKILPSPGGSGVNVDPANPYAIPAEMNITISFNTASGEAVALNNITVNPYLIVNQERGKEVHLAGFAPTSKANATLFGTGQDDTNPTNGKYYKSKNNLPWALSVPAEIPYPKTKIDFLQAYKKFATWAESNGASYSDWYLDLTDYRDNSKLYTAP